MTVAGSSLSSIAIENIKKNTSSSVSSMMFQHWMPADMGFFRTVNANLRKTILFDQSLVADPNHQRSEATSAFIDTLPYHHEGNGDLGNTANSDGEA
ncbi:hypothetical protein RB195_015691 [Necator americanus]|uniref:Uncharacterized protein n=1 Tax=Necator americanus TaxID=51031 RepID=A0ABR1E5Q1_NECAM